VPSDPPSRRSGAPSPIRLWPAILSPVSRTRSDTRIGRIFSVVVGYALLIGGVVVFILGISLAIFGGSGRPPGETATATAKVVANGRRPRCFDTAAFMSDGHTYKVQIRTKAVIGSFGGGALCRPRPLGTTYTVAYSPSDPNLASIQLGNHRLEWVLFGAFGLILGLIGAVILP
jgi:hypothetical protein